jgi:hypothetical protein
MTNRFNVNVLPNDGTDAMFKWMTWMTTSSPTGPGWTLVASSDGYGKLNANSTSVNNTPFTRNLIPDADTLKGYKSWFVMRAPGGNATDGYKEICVQQLSKTNTATQDPSSWGTFRVKFSPFGFKSDGSQFQAPSGKIPSERANGSTAAHGKKDEIVWGGGSDASPTGVDVFGPAGFKMHMMASDSDGYGFYFFTTHVGTTRVRTVVMLDPMLSGSYPSPQDKQPFVWFGRIYGGSGSTNALTVEDMNSSSIQNSSSLYYQGSFFNYGNTLETFAGVGMAAPSLKNFWNGQKEVLARRIPSNPHTGKDDLFPAMWIKPDPDLWGNNATGSGQYAADGWPYLAFGYKGISSLMKIVSTARNTLDTLSVTQTGDRIVVNDMCLPWLSGTTPQL